MRKSFIISLMLLCALFCNAQHLTYTSLKNCINTMKSGITAFNDAMESRGYHYAGMNSSETKAVWCNNCTYNFTFDEFTWTTGELRSLLIFYVFEDESCDIKYICPNRSSYKAFKSAAKQDGYKFLEEGMKKEYIYSKYKNKDGVILSFFEYSDKYQYEVIFHYTKQS